MSRAENYFMCACGIPIIPEDDEDEVMCENCGRVYDRNGNLLGLETGEDMILGDPTQQQIEDRIYVNSGIDNFWSMSDEEVDALFDWLRETGQ